MCSVPAATTLVLWTTRGTRRSSTTRRGKCQQPLSCNHISLESGCVTCVPPPPPPPLAWPCKLTQTRRCFQRRARGEGHLALIYNPCMQRRQEEWHGYDCSVSCYCDYDLKGYAGRHAYPDLLGVTLEGSGGSRWQVISSSGTGHALLGSCLA